MILPLHRNRPTAKTSPAAPTLKQEAELPMLILTEVEKLV